MFTLPQDVLDLGWAKFGRFMGYPECCLAAFKKDACKETKEAYPDAPWWGTGYVPCMHCAQLCKHDFKQFIKDNITPYRSCPTPFPSEKGWDGMKEFSEQIWADAKAAVGRRCSAPFPPEKFERSFKEALFSLFGQSV